LSNWMSSLAMEGLSQLSGRQSTNHICSYTVAISSNLEHRLPWILDTMTFGTKSGTVGIVLMQRLRMWCVANNCWYGTYTRYTEAMITVKQSSIEPFALDIQVESKDGGSASWDSDDGDDDGENNQLSTQITLPVVSASCSHCSLLPFWGSWCSTK